MNRIDFTRFQGLDYACKEAINTLCTNLGFLGKDKRVIMFTSSDAHEGKSFLTINTMRTLAQLGNKVVLVDTDLRRSQLVSGYGVRMQTGKGYGLAHYLAGRCEMDEILYETDILRAYLVPVGQEVSNSLTLLNSQRFGRLIADLRERFDYVIVDAPPVGVIIDAAEIAKSCSGALMAIAYNEVHRNELLEAKRQLEQTGCPILGTVLNGVELTNYNSRRYYKSYYSYYTNSEEDGNKQPKGRKSKPPKDK